MTRARKVCAVADPGVEIDKRFLMASITKLKANYDDPIAPYRRKFRQRCNTKALVSY